MKNSYKLADVFDLLSGQVENQVLPIAENLGGLNLLAAINSGKIEEEWEAAVAKAKAAIAAVHPEFVKSAEPFIVQAKQVLAGTPEKQGSEVAYFYVLREAKKDLIGGFGETLEV